MARAASIPAAARAVARAPRSRPPAAADAGAHPTTTPPRRLHAVPIEVLDAIPHQAAVIDARGVIVHVNDAWSRFAQTNGLDSARDFGVGINYFDTCDAATGDCREQALAMARGIRAVTAGDKAIFSQTYDCSSPEERRLFQVRVTRFDADGEPFALVCHENISTLGTQRVVVERRSSRLSPREREVFGLVTRGLLNKQIAAELGLSEKTVEVHRGRVMRKMEAESLAGLVRMAVALETTADWSVAASA